jgi:hypothetical protein
MVRKKSVQSKVKTKKEAYTRQLVRLRVSRSWRILILIMKAVKIFLNSRRDASIAASLPPSFGELDADLIPLNCIGFRNKDTYIVFSNITDAKKQFEDYIIQKIIKNLISKVSRLDAKRIKKMHVQKKKKQTSNATFSKEVLILKRTRQRIWVKNKYAQNISFRKQKNECRVNHFRNKYQNNKDFREKQKDRINKHVLDKYHSNIQFRNDFTARSKISQ